MWWNSPCALAQEPCVFSLDKGRREGRRGSRRRGRGDEKRDRRGGSRKAEEQRVGKLHSWTCSVRIAVRIWSSVDRDDRNGLREGRVGHHRSGDRCHEGGIGGGAGGDGGNGRGEGVGLGGCSGSSSLAL